LVKPFLPPANTKILLFFSFEKYQTVKDLTKLWFGLALIFFLLTALAGLLLRWLPLQSLINNNYYFGILQAHSHTGFLGWIFVALYILLLKKTGKDKILTLKKTNIILFVLSFLLIAMYISFPFDGYGAFSITFLSLFLLFSYYALIYLYKNVDPVFNNSLTKKFLLTGIIFYFISSISPWLLGPIIAMGYKKSELYYNNIFFYLHFLYNGFVFFAIVSLFVADLEFSNIRQQTKQKLHTAFLLLTTGTILNYSESLLWSNHTAIMHITAFISSILILTAVFLVFTAGFKTKITYRGIAKFILIVVFFSVSLKIVLHLLQAAPYLSKISYHFKSYFIIGYIHLVTLGLFSTFILAYSVKHNIIKPGKTFNAGAITFITGFFLTEILLFLQGILLWNNVNFLIQYYDFSIFTASLIMFCGICMITAAYLKQK